jgi:sn-glycerol 3-phosphate transport system ATP-binding protein
MEAMTLADRLVVLNGGRIEQLGTPIELYEKPATTFVATFIGSPSMNLLAMPATRGQWVLSAAASPPPGAATLGIRPEDLHLSAEDADDAFRADVKVAAVELVGAESYVHGTLADDSPVVFRVAGRSRIAMDDRVAIGAKASSLHYFDQQGARLRQPGDP